MEERKIGGKKLINGLSPEYEWKRNFRMSREMFIELCQKLRPHISPGTTPNYRFLTLEGKVSQFKESIHL